jgi:S1-C subfamily serine protease
MKMKKAIVLLVVLLTSCAHFDLSSNVINNNQGIVLLRGSTTSFSYTATAFAIERDAKGTLLLTNKHACVDDAVLSIKDTSNNEYKAIVVKRAQFEDLCLIHTDAILPVLKLGNKDASYGQFVVVDGCGRGICEQIVTGYAGKYIEIKNDDAGIYAREQLLTTPIYPGNSGSCVMDASGRVVGIINLGIPDAPTEAIMIPISSVLRFLDSSDDVIK